MELEYLAKVLEAKKEDYEKQNNLKKFYKETLTDEEYKSFEKILKTRKSEINELESIVKKMNSYSDQYKYERIMAMTEIEFDAIRDNIIEAKKDEIRKHNKDINEKNSSINSEINDLQNDNLDLKSELEEMTNEIGKTGTYTKETVERAKEIKSQIKANNDKIAENKKAILDNDSNIISNGEVDLDFESYRKEKLEELSDKKYVEVIPEVSIMDEFLCKLQKMGKTPEEIETALNNFKVGYIGGYEKEGYEYFDPVYRKDLDALEEDDKNASDTTELLEKYFEIAEKNKAKCPEKAIIERNMKVAYNTNKRHNISKVTKERLLEELVDGKPYSKELDENEIVNNGFFINLKDRIIIQKERINRVIAWKNNDSGNTTLAKVVTHIKNYKDLSKNEEKNIDEIEKIFAKLRKYFDETCFDGCDAAIEFTTLYDELSKSCAKLKAFNNEKKKLSSKKIVINKKEQANNISKLDADIEDIKDYIKEIHKRINKDLNATLKYTTGILEEPEKIMYPEITNEPTKENIFSHIHTKNEHNDFSLEEEKEYLYDLENDFKNAIMLLERYDEVEKRKRRAVVTTLCDDLEISSIPDGIVEVLFEEKDNDPVKASNISKRINEARVNLYLREQKEKAISEASKAKSEVLGAVVNHLDLEETKTDIFAAI